MSPVLQSCSQSGVLVRSSKLTHCYHTLQQLRQSANVAMVSFYKLIRSRSGFVDAATTSSVYKQYCSRMKGAQPVTASTSLTCKSYLVACLINSYNQKFFTVQKVNHLPPCYFFLSHKLFNCNSMMSLGRFLSSSKLITGNYFTF